MPASRSHPGSAQETRVSTVASGPHELRQEYEEWGPSLPSKDSGWALRREPRAQVRVTVTSLGAHRWY